MNRRIQRFCLWQFPLKLQDISLSNVNLLSEHVPVFFVSLVRIRIRRFLWEYGGQNTFLSTVNTFVRIRLQIDISAVMVLAKNVGTLGFKTYNYKCRCTDAALELLTIIIVRTTCYTYRYIFLLNVNLLVRLCPCFLCIICQNTSLPLRIWWSEHVSFHCKYFCQNTSANRHLCGHGVGQERGDTWFQNIQLQMSMHWSCAGAADENHRQDDVLYI